MSVLQSRFDDFPECKFVRRAAKQRESRLARKFILSGLLKSVFDTTTPTMTTQTQNCCRAPSFGNSEELHLCSQNIFTQCRFYIPSVICPGAVSIYRVRLVMLYSIVTAPVRCLVK